MTLVSSGIALLCRDPCLLIVANRLTRPYTHVKQIAYHNDAVCYAVYPKAN